MKKIIAGIASAGMTAAVCFTAFAGTWKLDSRGWWYQNDNGTWPSGGWQKIKGEYYYFDPERSDRMQFGNILLF